MGTTYERASNAITALVEKTLEAYHPELLKQRVTVDVSIVRRTKGKHEEEVHALLLSGYPIDAKIAVTSLADRARGIADAKLVIDALAWGHATDRQRAALVDHELEHLDIVHRKPSKKNGYDSSPRRDDLGRPMLKLRAHDWQLVGFRDVALRHKEHSHEALQFANFRAEFAQLDLFAPSVLAITDGAKPKRQKKARRKK